jgi:hypothetical protein
MKIFQCERFYDSYFFKVPAMLAKIYSRKEIKENDIHPNCSREIINLVLMFQDKKEN